MLFSVCHRVLPAFLESPPAPNSTSRPVASTLTRPAGEPMDGVERVEPIVWSCLIDSVLFSFYIFHHSIHFISVHHISSHFHIGVLVSTCLDIFGFAQRSLDSAVMQRDAKQLLQCDSSDDVTISVGDRSDLPRLAPGSIWLEFVALHIHCEDLRAPNPPCK